MGGAVCKALCRRQQDLGDVLEVFLQAQRQALGDVATLNSSDVAALATHAMDELLRLHELEAGFLREDPADGVDLWVCQAAGVPAIVRGRLCFGRGLSAEYVISAAADYALKPTWDTQFSHGGVLSTLPESEGTSRFAVAWEAVRMLQPEEDAPPSMGRDFVLAQLVKRFGHGRVATVARSIDAPCADGAAPEIQLPAGLAEGALLRDYVRAHSHLSGFVASVSSGGNLSVTYICQIDLRGSATPDQALAFMRAEAQCLKAFKEAMIQQQALELEEIEAHRSATALCDAVSQTSSRPMSRQGTPGMANDEQLHHLSVDFHRIGSDCHSEKDVMDLLQRLKGAKQPRSPTNPGMAKKLHTPEGTPPPDFKQWRAPLTKDGALEPNAIGCSTTGRARDTSTLMSGDQRWRPGIPMPTRRNNCAAAVVGERIFVCGGSSGPQARLDTLDVFDRQAATWTAATAMRAHRSSCAAASLGDSIYVCGGLTNRGKQASIERFDLPTGCWVVTAPMRSERCALSLVTLDGVLYACGGFDDNHNLSSVERMDPRMSLWMPVAPMASRRFAFGAVVLCDTIYACGGSDGSCYLASAECYDARMDAWRPIAAMGTPRSSFAAVAFEGLMLACGGRDSGRATLATVEHYDPHTCSWTAGPAMVQPRAGHVGGVLCDEILICGGTSTSVELLSSSPL